MSGAGLESNLGALAHLQPTDALPRGTAFQDKLSGGGRRALWSCTWEPSRASAALCCKLGGVGGGAAGMEGRLFPVPRLCEGQLVAA